MRWSRSKELLRSIHEEMERDHLALVAAGVAFFGFLALFPAFAALIAIYGLLFDPAHVQEQMAQLDQLLPADARTLIGDQLSRLADAAPTSLSVGMAIALLVALWSATKGTRGVIRAINVAYDATETRGFVRLNLVALLLTAGGIAFFMVAVALSAGVPAVLGWVGLEGVGRAWVHYGRWPLLLLVVLVAVSALYAIAPNRDASERRRLVTPGVLLATFGLVGASALFSLYVSRFGDYNEIYGSLGAVAVFMLWLYLASFVVLLGAEIDAVLEAETGTEQGAENASRFQHPVTDRGAPA
jgi:membrane protein